jgi:hypothetical protein
MPRDDTVAYTRWRVNVTIAFYAPNLGWDKCLLDFALPAVAVTSAVLRFSYLGRRLCRQARVQPPSVGTFSRLLYEPKNACYHYFVAVNPESRARLAPGTEPSQPRKPSPLFSLWLYVSSVRSNIRFRNGIFKLYAPIQGNEAAKYGNCELLMLRTAVVAAVTAITSFSSLPSSTYN